MRWALCFFCSLFVAACHGSEAQPELDGKDAAEWRRELEDAATRDAALRRLSSAGEEARPILIALLRVPRGHAPVVAAQMLAEHGAPAVPALTDAVAARADSVRIAAAAALGLIGESARSAVAPLRAMRDSQEPTHLRIAACVGLWGVTRDPAEVMPTMLEGLRSGVPEVVFAATGLAALVGAPAVTPLTVALESDVPGVRVAACDALAAIGKDAAPARRKLEALLQDREPAVRSSARAAITALDQGASR